MTTTSGRPDLRGALEREHREIDTGIEAFLDDPTATSGLARAVAALRRHIYLEEEHLFPPLQAAGLLAPVLVMLKEHGEMWPMLDEIEALVADGAGVAELAPGLELLLELLDRHNEKEEPIVYAAAEQRLDAATTERLAELVATSTMPADWVCRQARPR